MKKIINKALIVIVLACTTLVGCAAALSAARTAVIAAASLQAQAAEALTKYDLDKHTYFEEKATDLKTIEEYNALKAEYLDYVKKRNRGMAAISALVPALKAADASIEVAAQGAHKQIDMSALINAITELKAAFQAAGISLGNSSTLDGGA